MALVARGKQLQEFISNPLGTLRVFLWVSTLVFFKLRYAVMHGTQILEQFGVNNKQISICSDSQAAFGALRNPKITSRLVWDCIVAYRSYQSRMLLNFSGFLVTAVYTAMNRQTI